MSICIATQFIHIQRYILHISFLCHSVCTTYLYLYVESHSGRMTKTFSLNIRLVVQSRRFYVIILHVVCRSIHISPGYGNDISTSCREVGESRFFPNSVLFSPFVQLVRRTATQVFFPVSNKKQQQFAIQ